MKNRLPIIAAAALLALTFAGSAAGSTVGVQGSAVHLAAAAAESNVAWVATQPATTVSGVRLETVLVADAAGLSVLAPIPPEIWATLPVPGCRVLAEATRAECRAPEISSITADLGDSDDYFANYASDYSEGSLPVTVDGGAGNDFLKGGLAGDTLLGSAGDDELFGNGGNDVLSGGAGSDSLTGGAGQDSVDGGPDSDYVRIADGSLDSAVCGDGSDWIASWDAIDSIATDCENYYPA